MSFPDLSTPAPAPPPRLTPNSTPILTQLPSSQTAFTRKYTDRNLQSALSNISPALRKSLIDFDLKRVNKGQPPLSAQQTLLALQTVQQRKAATPPEDQGFLSRLASDARALIDVPHIVAGLVSEVQQLPDAPAKLSEVLGRGGAQEVVGGLSEVPGLRFIPGVYTASTLANEGPSGLLEHPLFTALDVLPYAKPGIGRAVESSLSRLPSVKKVRAALPDIVESPSAFRIAARQSPTVEHFATTHLATKIRTSFGSLARDVAQIKSSAETTLGLQSKADLPENLLDHPALTAETEVIRAAINDAHKWSRTIPEERMTELTSRIKLDRHNVLFDPLISDAERGFVNEYINHVDELADFKVQRQQLHNIDGEIFERGQGAKILSSRRNVARVESVNSARKLVEQAKSGVAPIIDMASIKSEHLNATLREQLLRGYAHAYDAAGFDARALKDVLNAQRGPDWKTVGHTRAIEELQRLVDSPIPRPQISQADLSSLLKGFARTDSSYARVWQDVHRGDYSNALKTFRTTLGARTKTVHPQTAEIFDALIRGRDRQKFLNDTKPLFGDKRVKQVRAQNAKLEAGILPARWMPHLEKLSGERLFEMFSHDVPSNGMLAKGFPQLETALRDNPKLLRDIEKDVMVTVQELRKSGIDPVFVHRVSPSQVGQINYPKITDAFRTPTSIRKRTGDATPYVDNAAVAISHEGVELLSEMASKTFIDHIIETYGKSEVDVVTPYVDRAVQMSQRDPALSPRAHAQELMLRAYTKYDPKNIFPHQKASIATVPKNTVYLPKVVERTLHDMFHDQGFKFTAALDPVMNLFRLAVLPYSIRYHINNIGGGAMLMAVESPRALLNLKRGRDFVKSGEYAKVQGLPPSGLGSMPRELIEWGHQATFSDKVLAAHQWLGARTMARWSQEAKKVTGKVTQGADYLYEFNGKIDDIYRATMLITGRDKALTKGLSTAESEAAGVALVRKILPEWDRQTPFERNIVRSVFPFYTFARFVLGYAYRYPMDHPFRIAVTSSIARNEMEDFGDSLPLNFMSMFFLGHPDDNGNVTALNLGGINPFQDVANYFTLAGYTGKVNPVISAALEAVGVDPSKGTQDLYPDIAYDPITGRLKPSNPNFLSSLVTNVIPQSQLITAVLGRNEQFKGLLESNPDAAAAMLRSSAGLPNLFRNINPAHESFKAELQRETSQSNVKNEALRTGDWSRAQNFPQLRAYFQQVAALMGTSPEVFAGMVPTTERPSELDAAKNAIAGLKP